MPMNKHALVLSTAVCALAAAAAQAQTSQSSVQPGSTDRPSGEVQQPVTEGQPQVAQSTGPQADATSGQTAQANNQTNSAPTTQLKEVVVSSYRSSLEASLRVKENAMGVEDSIQAEDVGKFPDANVADALQRIPGIAIDRNEGEGRYVTIRGLGPTFNVVLLNGRPLTSEDGTRAFSFDVLPADLISAADVYKSGEAYLPAGALGGTINLKTLRPFDLKPTEAVLSVKEMDDDDRNFSSVQPQAFAMLSKQFDDGKFGVLGAFSYEERKFADDFYDQTWATFSTGRGTGSVLNPAATLINPGDLSTGFYMQQWQSGVQIIGERRETAQYAIQYRPVDTLTFTADGLYSDFIQQTDDSFLLDYQNIGNLSSLQLNPDGTSVKQVETLNGAGAYEQWTAPSLRHPVTKEGGLNADWEPTDSLSVVGDASMSRTDASPQDTQGLVSTGFRGPDQMLGYGGETPTDFDIPSTQAELSDLSNQHLHVIIPPGWGTQVDEKIWNGKIDVTWSPDVEGHPVLRSGFDYTRSNVNVTGYGTLVTEFLGYLIPVNIPASDYTVFPYAIPSGPHMLWVPPIDYMNYAASPAGFAATDAAFGFAPGTAAAEFAANGGWETGPNASGYGVKEEDEAGYLDLSFKGDFGSMPWETEFGGRYEATSTIASGYGQDVVEIERGQDATSYVPVYASSLPALTTQQHTYGEFLPNFDYKLTMARDRFLPNDSLLLRLSWARSLTRPDLTELAPSLTLNLPRPNFLNGSGGNVDLKPYTADNYDLGLEYYWGRINYLSIDGFDKDIRDFITEANVTRCFTIQNPDNISDEAISGNQACYSILEPQNTSTAHLYGVEIDGQFGFTFLPSPFDGLGVIANLTYVQSNAAYNPAILNQVFAIPGLSDTRNYTLFYSKGPVEARVAYSWRGKFYEEPAGFGIEPRFDDPYDQVDAQVSYDLSGLVHQDVKLLLQGTNLTNSKLLKSGRYDDQFAHEEWTGPSYAIQVRARF